MAAPKESKKDRRERTTKGLTRKQNDSRNARNLKGREKRAAGKTPGRGKTVAAKPVRPAPAAKGKGKNRAATRAQRKSGAA